MRFSDNIQNLTPSATIAVGTRAKQLRAEGRDIINLSQGEPDFDTPGFIADAGVEAIRAGHTRYTPAAGLPELREAVARDLARMSGADTDPAGVVVSTGAKQALFNACFVLFGPGDRVLLPAPYWTSYPQIVHLTRAEPVEVRGDAERSFKVTPEELEAACDERVRGLVLNSPSNPSGAVYTRGELEAIARWAAERGVWIISDEIYNRIYYGDGHAPGMLELDPVLRERVVVINGASKAFAMTGWRIGYSYTAPELAGKIAALQSHTTSNASTPSQYAALAAFTADPERMNEVHAMVDAFRVRRDRVRELFGELLPSVSYVEPEGAFYLFFRVDDFFDASAPDSVALCTWLLDEAGVALVPGAAFGDDRYVRLSFATSEEVLAEGIGRMATALGRR